MASIAALGSAGQDGPMKGFSTLTCSLMIAKFGSAAIS
jgi:hypothetical protein